MKFTPATLGGIAVVLLLGPLPGVRADLIPWMYNWSRTPTEVHADAPGTGYITLTDEANRLAAGDSDIVATNLKTFSTATNANKDVFTARPYKLTLTLTDLQTTPASGTITFSGQIDGWLTAQSSLLRNTFTGQTTQELVLAGNRYTVTIGPYTPPGIPGSTNSGSIASLVSVKVEAIVQQLPEPGAIVLTSVGGLVLGVAGSGRCRKRRAGT